MHAHKVKLYNIIIISQLWFQSDPPSMSMQVTFFATELARTCIFFRHQESLVFVYSLWHWEILVDEKVLVHVDSYKLCSVGLMKTY